MKKGQGEGQVKYRRDGKKQMAVLVIDKAEGFMNGTKVSSV